MKESNFNSEVMTSLKTLGAWCYKIADSPTSWTMSKTRFTPDKPCDIVACYGGKFFAIEGKQIKSFKAFGLSSMRPSQIENLDAVVAAGGQAYVFLNIRIKSPRVDRCLIFEWRSLKKYLENKSLKKKDLLDWKHVLKQGTSEKRIYNLTGFLQSVARGQSKSIQ